MKQATKKGNYMEDWFEVKTVADCIEAATVDAYGDDELISGWCCCLEEVFGEASEIKIAGEIFNLSGMVQEGTTILAVCEKGKKKIKVSLESIELIKPTKVQKLWLKAWLSWKN
jgi:hypothetical protein